MLIAIVGQRYRNKLIYRNKNHRKQRSNSLTLNVRHEIRLRIAIKKCCIGMQKNERSRVREPQSSSPAENTRPLLLAEPTNRATSCTFLSTHESLDGTLPKGSPRYRRKEKRALGRTLFSTAHGVLFNPPIVPIFPSSCQTKSATLQFCSVALSSSEHLHRITVFSPWWV